MFGYRIYIQYSLSKTWALIAKIKKLVFLELESIHGNSKSRVDPFIIMNI